MRSTNTFVLLFRRSTFAKSHCLAESRWVDGLTSSTLRSSMLASSRQQAAPDHEQVRQRARHLQSVQILRQAAIPNLGKPKQTFDHPEGMFDSRADLRLGSVLAPFGLVNLTVVAVALVRKILRPRCTPVNHIGLTSVGLVAVHPSLLSMQQVRQSEGVGNVRGRGFHGMDELL